MSKYKNAEEVLADMPLFQEDERKCREHGFKTDGFHKVADPNEPFCFFFKNGKCGYKSDCPNYGGFYNDCPKTAIVCKAVDFLLPGILLDTYCRLHHDECPLHQNLEVDANEKTEKTY